MMNRTKLIALIAIILLLLVTIFLLVDKRKINKQNNEISELEDKLHSLEKKNSDLENEKEELENKVSQLSESDNSFSQVQTMPNHQSNLPQTDIEYPTSGTGFATVVFRQSSCDYFILENASGYIVAEWMGGNDPDQGDKITGNFKSFGTKEFYNQSRDRDCKLWVDDYLLSKESALEKIRDKCN